MNIRPILAALLCCMLLPGHIASAEGKDDESRRRPITVAASTEGRFAKGFSWYLSVNSAGDAELFVNAWPQSVRQKLVITKEQFTSLSDALDRERFFDLKDEYGQHVPDGSADTLTIVRGGQTKTVRIHFLMNWVHDNPKLLLEPARAVRVFNLIRNWFSVPEAVDLRRYDQMVLDAASEKNTHAQPTGGADAAPATGAPSAHP